MWSLTVSPTRMAAMLPMLEARPAWRMCAFNMTTYYCDNGTGCTTLPSLTSLTRLWETIGTLRCDSLQLYSGTFLPALAIAKYPAASFSISASCSPPSFLPSTELSQSRCASSVVGTLWRPRENSLSVLGHVHLFSCVLLQENLQVCHDVPQSSVQDLSLLTRQSLLVVLLHFLSHAAVCNLEASHA